MARLVLRIELDSDARIGSDHIRLLELVGTQGSITAAARAHGLSYRRAWALLDEVNRMFKAPVIATECGGAAGGGARPTAFGHDLIARYRGIEAIAVRLTAHELAALEAVARFAAPTAPARASSR
jgi:molybdate transport system regulatory protein